LLGRTFFVVSQPNWKRTVAATPAQNEASLYARVSEMGRCSECEARGLQVEVRARRQSLEAKSSVLGKKRIKKKNTVNANKCLKLNNLPAMTHSINFGSPWGRVFAGVWVFESVNTGQRRLDAET